MRVVFEASEHAEMQDMLEGGEEGDGGDDEGAEGELGCGFECVLPHARG